MATDIIARAIGKSAKDKTDKITVNNNINLDIVSSTLAETTQQINENAAEIVHLRNRVVSTTDEFVSVILNEHNDGYYTTTGAFFNDTYRRYAIITPVTVGDTYKLSTYLRSTIIPAILYFNGDTFLSYEKVGTGTGEVVIDYEFTIPANCSKIIVQSSDKTRQPFSLSHLERVIRPKCYTKDESDSRFGHKYGVKWSLTDNNDLGQRCFAAVGLNATIGIGSTPGYSDFDNIYPWSEMKRCNIKVSANGAALVTYEGEAGFALDGTNGDVFVRIPKFNILRYIDNGYEYRVIGVPGSPVHEAFIENGKELDEIFIGAFEGYIDSEGKLRSIAGVIPTSNEYPATYLTSAVANGNNYSLYDMRCVDAIWTLMAIEYGCRNTNRIIGYGISDFMQPMSVAHLNVVETAVNTNSVKTQKFSASDKARMPVGSTITICKGSQATILAQRKIISVEDTVDGLYTVFTFDGDGVDVDTTCFIGSGALPTNFTETCDSPASWHTGRANWIAGSITHNPIRYRWIEIAIGNLWHFLPDVTFYNRQMYVCKSMVDYEFHKHDGSYNPVGPVLIVNTDNGNKSDASGANYWIDKLLNDTFAKAVPFGKSYDKALVSTKAFGAYYYLDGTSDTAFCIANGGGFDHLYRCNMLTNRAWVTAKRKWYLYGARMMYKHLN